MAKKKTSGNKRRATAASMAAGQRDISVSEFFAKNRHLLGFDSPRKSLLTTVKEAVDNALDACEEAGIMPEIWVHVAQVGKDRYKVGVQDNGPGILKKQIPLIFAKLLYGSKFHRLRMSRGQQGIGISAAGMYGLLTTGKPVKIVSRISSHKTHYYEVQIDTKLNKPQILNGKGEGIDIPLAEGKRQALMAKHGIEWTEVDHGTRVTIELEAKYQRGRGSVDEYLEQTAVANPHVAIHYLDPDDIAKDYHAVTDKLPPEPKEIKPHPYGVELGRLIEMLRLSPETTLAEFFRTSFCRVTPGAAQKFCKAAGVTTRTRPHKINRDQADAMFEEIQQTRLKAPELNCLVPIGEQQILEGLHQVVPAEFYAAATRPPAVYRGNPFQIEVGIAYGGGPMVHRITKAELIEMIEMTDERTVRQFLANTFDGVGHEAADRFIKKAKIKSRLTPSRLSDGDIDRLLEVMQSINLAETQTMNVLRYANRVPLQFQAGGCAVTQAVMGTNWKGYGLMQSRNNLPRGPVTVMVHLASVWVPFTSESKEAIAEYEEIQKELRLALQAVGRKLGMFLRKRQKVKKEGERRAVFMRYLDEVATATAEINGGNQEKIYADLLAVAKKVTAQADVQLDDRGKVIKEEENAEDYGSGVLVVTPEERHRRLAELRGELPEDEDAEYEYEYEYVEVDEDEEEDEGTEYEYVYE